MKFLQETTPDTFLSFDDWMTTYGEEIYIYLAESGADRELDFNQEEALAALYKQYEGKQLIPIAFTCISCKKGKVENIPQSEIDLLKDNRREACWTTIGVIEDDCCIPCQEEEEACQHDHDDIW